MVLAGGVVVFLRECFVAVVIVNEIFSCFLISVEERCSMCLLALLAS